METGYQDAHRFVVTQTANTLLKDATDAARSSPAGSPEWRFYHGVETAALHVLHPEIAVVREGTRWLDAESAPFRRGFLEGSAALAAATAAADPPLRVRLPEPSAPAATDDELS